MKQFCTAR